MIATVIGHALIIAGAGLIVSAGLGIIRLPDIYNRANAVTKAAALGVVLILAGVVFLLPGPAVVLTVLVAIAAQLFTAPIAGYAVGRAAYRSGVPLARSTLTDELAPVHRTNAPPSPEQGSTGQPRH